MKMMPRAIFLAAALLLAPTVYGQTARCRACDEAGGDYADPLGVDKADLSGERIKPQTAMPLAVDQGAAGLAETLKKLRTRASLMLIVAHPDDEDSGMLAYEVRGQGVEAAMLTLTRGEGGQNLMSADFNDALGLIRTQELLAEDRYSGVDQLFGTEVDFGFSKTKEESFAQWTHDRVLYDGVRAVRLYRPLVLASVFVGGLTDGHGQHQVSGEIAQEVYDAAGDPTVFPEMIAAGLQPWTPLKVYARVPFAKIDERGMFDYATSKYEPVKFYNYVTKTWTEKPPTANVTIPEGEFSKLLGMSYVQFARKGLALQKTQIAGNFRLAPAGKFDVGYTRYGSRVKTPEQEASFFDGIDTTLPGIATLAPEGSATRTLLAGRLAEIDALVAKAAAAYSEADPSATAPALKDGLLATNALIAQVESADLAPAVRAGILHELRVKRVQFNTALVEALGIKLEAHAIGTLPLSTGQPDLKQSKDKPHDAATTLSAVPGEYVLTDVKVSIGAPIAATKDLYPQSLSIDVDGATKNVHTFVFPPDGKGQKRTPAEKYDFVLSDYDQLAAAQVPSTAPLTRPAFTRANAEQPFYTPTDPGLRNARLPLAPLVVWAKFLYDKVEIRVGTAVMTGPEDAQAPVAVVPEISVSVSPSGGILPLSDKELHVTAHVKTEVAAAHGDVHLELPAGWQSKPADARFALKEIGDTADLPFTLIPAGLVAKPYTITAVASFAGRDYHEGFRSVGYQGLEPVNLYEPAVDRVTAADVKIAPNLHIGYLPGTGDSVAGSLASLGVKVTQLTAADVVAGKLAGFDAVVLGVRAYAAHPELQGTGSAGLLAYAQNGGTVIVQYVTGRFDAASAPYPLALGTEERVVVETDPVTLLKPADRILNWPNRLTPADFEGWTEERGHGFMGTWDAHYDALLEMHDPDEDPQKGGLLVAHTGKGTWVYCALALYRQLPAGVPGAYRLFANLLSIGSEQGHPVVP